MEFFADRVCSVGRVGVPPKVEYVDTVREKASCCSQSKYSEGPVFVKRKHSWASSRVINKPFKTCASETLHFGSKIFYQEVMI